MAEKKPILVVDDDQTLALGVGRRLRREGCDVAHAPDAIAAVSAARREEPDLIILDMGLPAGGGMVVLERLRSNFQLSAIPVVVLTGGGSSLREKTLDAGADAFFEKPASEELYETIENLLGD